MLGETVCVLSREQVGTDSMGEALWEWGRTYVEGVLVRPLDATELGQGDSSSHLRPDGVHPRYRLAFPKAYSGPPLAHARVALVDRGMDPSDADAAYRVVGEPDKVIPSPLKWDMYADVGRVDG